MHVAFYACVRVWPKLNHCLFNAFEAVHRLRNERNGLCQRHWIRTGCILPVLCSCFCFVSHSGGYDWTTDEMRTFFFGGMMQTGKGIIATKSNAIVKSNSLENNSDETNACPQCVPVCACSYRSKEHQNCIQYLSFDHDEWNFEQFPIWRFLLHPLFVTGTKKKQNKLQLKWSGVEWSGESKGGRTLNLNLNFLHASNTSNKITAMLGNSGINYPAPGSCRDKLYRVKR